MTSLLLSDSDFSPRIKTDLNRSVFQTGSIFILLIIFKLWLKIPLSYHLYCLIFLLFLMTVILALYLRREKTQNTSKVISFHFYYNFFSMIILTVIIYYTGGITWIMPIFYSFTIVNSFWIYPRKLAVLMLGWCCILFTLLVLLQYLRILSGIYIFRPEEQVFENFFYVLLTAFGGAIVLICAGLFSNNFYTLFNNKIKELKKTKGYLQETKRSLLAEIAERTKEAEIEREKLREEVERRTEELENRREGVREKVKELEKFHEVAVEREMKMVGLKEEINKFKRKEGRL